MFTYMLKIEAIGNANRQKVDMFRRIANECTPGAGNTLVGRAPSVGWCAEILGCDAKFRWKREFLIPMVDHKESSGSGNRGIYRCFLLKDGHVYEVYERLSWGRHRRYFCRIDSGTLIEMGQSEVCDWFQVDQ